MNLMGYTQLRKLALKVELEAKQRVSSFSTVFNSVRLAKLRKMVGLSRMLVAGCGSLRGGKKKVISVEEYLKRCYWCLMIRLRASRSCLA